MFKKTHKQRYIAGSSKNSRKFPSLLLTKIMTAAKEHLQTYFETTYARSGVNQMCILEHSQELFSDLKSQNLSSNSIKTYDFSTLYQPFRTIN